MIKPRSCVVRSVLMTALAVTPLSGQAPAPLAPSARVYLDSALRVMRAHVLGGDTVNWEVFRDQVHRRATGAEGPADTYEAIRWALRTLNPHSFLQLSGDLRARELARRPPNDPVEPAAAPRVRSPFWSRRQAERELHQHQGRRIGRIVVPAFGRRHVTAFADSIAGFVRELDSAGACGWIVDLRGNGGGNMWPMLAGLGPILGEGKVGEFHGPGGPTGRWYYRDGAAGIVEADGDTVEVARVSGPAYRLARLAPVAVLFDRGTGSSGEAVAIAFIGRPEARSFGTPSYGFTTSNDGFRLPDSANMVITVGVDADRAGRSYASRLTPDQLVLVAEGDSVPGTPPEDPQVVAALAWLVTQRNCQGR